MFSLKNLALVSGGLLVAGGLVFGWSTMSSYVRTGAGMAGDSVRDMVPTGFEIERLQTLVDDLDQTVADQRARLVKQQVDLDYLRREVAAAEDRAQGLGQEVGAARQVLAVHSTSYRIGERQYDRDQVVAEAQNKAERLVRAKAIADAKRETLQALEAALAQAEQQISAAEGQRETYAMRLAELRANAEQVEIRRELVTTLGTLPGDLEAGSFQEVEEAFARVERELQVQNRLLDDHTSAAPVSSITFAPADDGDILALLDRALGSEAAPIEGSAADGAAEPLPATAAAGEADPRFARYP